jgi:hypothetical protein
MCTIYRAVDAVPLVIDIRPYGVEEALPLSVLRPAIESIEYRLPRSERVREIPPRHAGAAPPQDRFEEISIVLRWPARAATRNQEELNLRPLPVVQVTSNHPGRAMEHASISMEKFVAPN